MSHAAMGAQVAPERPPSKVERIERALVLAAYVVMRYGEQYAPYIDRLEAELEEARRVDPMARAARILERYTREGGSNAIRSSQPLLSSSVSPSP